MKIRSERDKRNYIIVTLCAILVVMGVGYAAFSSLLTINGTANISNSWCVGFDNTMTSTMEVTKGVSTGTTPTGSMSYSGTACGSTLQPNSSLNAHFYQPGDQIEYTLTITNKSTVQAAIKSILVDNESVTSNKTITKGNITYIVEMPEDVVLAPNGSTTMKVIAKFQNETPIGSGYTGETKTIEVKINAEQDDGTGGMDITPVSNKYTGPIYRWSTTSVQNGNSIVPVSGTKWIITNGQVDAPFGPYETQSECETALAGYGFPAEISCQQKTGTFGGIGEYTTDASALNKTYYLKHDVVDDIITASYVCFVYNNAEHCMKGGDSGASFAANTQTIKDFQSFNNLPDNANPGCKFNSNYSNCRGGSFDTVYADSGGFVYVDGSSSEYCHVYNKGDSYCYVE